MDRYLVGINWLTEAFGGDRVWKFDIQPTDGATLFFGGEVNQTPVYRMGVQSGNVIGF